MSEDWFYLINYIGWAVILAGLGFYAYKACHPGRKAFTGVIMFLAVFFITGILGIFVGLLFLPKTALILPLMGAFFIARYAIKRSPTS